MSTAAVSPTHVPQEAFAVALALLPAVGPRRLLALVRSWPEPADAWTAVVEGRALSSPEVVTACHPHDPGKVAAAWRSAARAGTGPAGAWEACRAAEIGVTVLGDTAYPLSLAGDHEAPAVLFHRGDLAVLERPRAAIIGTRRCTPYGRELARQLGRELSEAGVSVVSGLALGIDGAAHGGALAAQAAPPIAVVGSGLDVVYPRRHRDLWANVAAAGVIVGEAPPGAEPEGWRFPARNRIIAALAGVVVVVESHLRGGSRHTVDAAMERGVTVMAVPGSVRSPASAGTNELLATGVPPARDVTDVLVALDLVNAGPATARGAPRPTPGGDDGSVLEALGWEPATVEQVVLRSGLGPAAVAVSLGHLQRDGWVSCRGAWWERVGEVPTTPAKTASTEV